MKKCEKCLNSRRVISENGFHPVCCLSQKASINCITGKKSRFITLEKDENDDIKVKF